MKSVNGNCTLPDTTGTGPNDGTYNLKFVNGNCT